MKEYMFVMDCQALGQYDEKSLAQINYRCTVHVKCICNSLPLWYVAMQVVFSKVICPIQWNLVNGARYRNSTGIADSTGCKKKSESIEVYEKKTLIK